jgi:hypothetical protein
MTVCDSGGAPGTTGSVDDFAGADELIADLAALLDAGLVVVHEPILGPVRYGVAPTNGSTRRRREGGTTELRRHHVRVR